MTNDPSDPLPSDDPKTIGRAQTPPPAAVPPGDWLYSEPTPIPDDPSSAGEHSGPKDPSSIGDLMALPDDPADALADLPPMTPASPASGWLDAADIGVGPMPAGSGAGASDVFSDLPMAREESDVIRGLSGEASSGNSSIFDGPVGGSSRFAIPSDATDDDVAAVSSIGAGPSPAEQPSGELFADFPDMPVGDVYANTGRPPVSDPGPGSDLERGPTGSSLFADILNPGRTAGSGVNLSDPDFVPPDPSGGPGSSIFDARPGAVNPAARGRTTGDSAIGDENTEAMLFDDRGLSPEQASNIFQRGASPGPDPGQISFDMPQARPGGKPESHDSGRIDWTMPQEDDPEVSNLLSEDEAREAGVPDDLGALQSTSDEDSLFGAAIQKRTMRRPKSRPPIDETSGVIFSPTGPVMSPQTATVGSWHDRPGSKEVELGSRRGGILGWIAGGGVGLLAGGAACVAVYFAGGVPNSESKDGHVVALQSALSAAQKQTDTQVANLTKQTDEAKQKANRADSDRRTAVDDLARQTKRASGAEKKLAQAEADRTTLAADLTTEKKSRAAAEAAVAKFDVDTKKLMAEFTQKVNVEKKTADDQTKLAAAAAARADDAAAKYKAADEALAGLVRELKASKLIDEKDDAATALAKAPDALKRAGAAAASADATKAAAALLAARKQLDDARAEVAAAKTAMADAEKGVAAARAEADTKVKEAVAAARTESGKTIADLTAKADALTGELQRTQADFRQRLAAKDEETARLLADARAGRVVAVTSSELRARDRAAELFALGVNAYASGRLPAAEAALDEATRLDGTDARVWYFLGLARFAQGKPADAAFRKGGELETRGLPNSRDVGLALEGVFGPARAALSAHRP